MIVDHIRQGDITGKEAIAAIKRRMFDRNPRVVLNTLTVS